MTVGTASPQALRASSLKYLVTPNEYQAANENVFPSTHSFGWFVRKHRVELVEAGALIDVTGRPMVDPQPMDSAVLKIGSRRAAARISKSDS